MRVVGRNRHSQVLVRQLNVRAHLPLLLEAKFLQCLDEFIAGNLARKFHKAASTGSATK